LSSVYTLFHAAETSPGSFESSVGLDEIFLKGYQVCEKVHYFSRISEISLDKFERIWSMKKRERDSAKGERANGS
jgi:hypothetical protein